MRRASADRLGFRVVLVCAVPHVVTILVGRYVLRLRPGVLLALWGSVLVVLRV